MSRFSFLPSLPSVQASHLPRLLEEGVLIVDVREPSEWKAGHAPHAVHLPLRTFASEGGNLPKDRKIVVVCRSGNRSRAATRALVQAGYDAYNLSGGMHAWVRAGLPIQGKAGTRGYVA